jgi:uncharacterized protein
MRLMKASLILTLVAIVAAVGSIVIGAQRIYPPIAALPPEATTTTANGIERRDLRFRCGETECAGWLFLPAADAKPGVVIMGHGFAGTRDVGLQFFAERFAQQGLAAFVFDYRHFGASGGAPRQLVDPWQQLDDWKAAIAFIRSLERIDPTRVALWGSSLGGGLALVAAARDGNVACIVAQAPQIDSRMEGEATFPGVWWAARLMLTAWGDLAASAFGAEPTTIAAIAPKGRFGMMIDDAAFKALEAVVHPGTHYRNEVAARSIFTFDDYNPALQTEALKAPVLLIASRDDRFAPFAAVEAFRKAHPTVTTVKEIQGDHFDIYLAPQSDQAAKLASEFLVVHLARR